MAAYPYSFSPYAQTYLPQNYAAPTPAPVVPQRAAGGINWVQGEAAARSQFVAPNSGALFMDSEASRFYIKATDASGMPLPLRVFEFKEITTADAVPAPTEEYVTRAEFDRALAELKEAGGDE